MQGMETSGDRRVTLYVRSLLPDGHHCQQRTILDRTAALVDDGTLADRTVAVWGDQAPATRAAAQTACERSVLDRLDTFREWAGANDLSLAPAFEVRTVDSAVTGESYRAVRFPAVTLAEFRDGALVCVTPHTADDGVLTVPDRLTALEAGRHAEFVPLDQSETTDAPGQVDSDWGVADRERGPITPE